MIVSVLFLSYNMFPFEDHIDQQEEGETSPSAPMRRSNDSFLIGSSDELKSAVLGRFAVFLV